MQVIQLFKGKSHLNGAHFWNLSFGIFVWSSLSAYVGPQERTYEDSDGARKEDIAALRGQDSTGFRYITILVLRRFLWVSACPVSSG